MTEAFHGLPEKTVAHLHNVFAGYPQVDKAILYGSRAMGNYKKGSDIDLSLHGERLTYKALMKIAGEIDELPIPYTVDLSVFDLLNHAKLKDHIKRVGKTFYKKEKIKWKKATLKEVCNIQPPKREIYDILGDDDEVSFMGMSLLEPHQKYVSSNVVKTVSEVYRNYQYFRDKDIIVAKITPCFENGKTGIVHNLKNGIGFGSSEFIVLRSDASTLPEYLYYFLSQANFREQGRRSMTGAAGQKRVPQNFIREFPIYLPPLSEQKRIVARLDTAFAQIDKVISACKRKQNQIEQLKKSALKSEIEGNKNLSSTWKTAKIDDTCEILDSQRRPITKRDRKFGKYPYYGATGIIDYISDYIFNDELILVGEDGAKWKAGEKTAFIAKGKYWVNNHAHVIKPYANVLLNKWLTHYLNCADLTPWIVGLTVPKLNQAQLRTIPIPLPPLAEQKRIVKKLDAIFEQADIALDAVKKQLTLYESLKSAILTSELGNKT